MPVPGDAVCSAREQESTLASASPSHSARTRTESSRGSSSSAQCLFMLAAASAASTRRAAAPRREAREAASPGRRSSSSCEMAAHAASRSRRTSSSWPGVRAPGSSGPRPRLLMRGLGDRAQKFGDENYPTTTRKTRPLDTTYNVCMMCMCMCMCNETVCPARARRPRR